MIEVVIPASRDMWDPVNECFADAEGYVLQLEHSLISLQKWESKWHKPFLTTDKTDEELLDYVRCMTINKQAPPEAYQRIPLEEMKRINDYIQDPMTATKIYNLSSQNSKKRKSSKNSVVTAEKIYYWMISCNIPSEYRKWHLNQLMTLIQVFDVENDTSKMSKTDNAAWRRAQNEARRKKLHTKG